MKADFEKGTKVCPKCKRELPISEFWEDGRRGDGLYLYCKECAKKTGRIRAKRYDDRERNTFGRRGCKRGNSGMLLRDYELTEGQLKRRNKTRDRSDRKSRQKRSNPHGIIVWYDGLLNDCSIVEYKRIMTNEYHRQKICAIRGYVGRTKPSEHFLFDFDLEQMLKDNVCYGNMRNKYYITKWWDGEIRHWTVNDGIWRK